MVQITIFYDKFNKEVRFNASHITMWGAQPEDNKVSVSLQTDNTIAVISELAKAKISFELEYGMTLKFDPKQVNIRVDAVYERSEAKTE